MGVAESGHRCRITRAPARLGSRAEHAGNSDMLKNSPLHRATWYALTYGRLDRTGSLARQFGGPSLRSSREASLQLQNQASHRATVEYGCDRLRGSGILRGQDSHLSQRPGSDARILHRNRVFITDHGRPDMRILRRTTPPGPDFSPPLARPARQRPGSAFRNSPGNPLGAHDGDG